MIRVNLISVAPGQAAAPARDWFPKEQRSAAIGLVLLLVTAVGITSWWWYLRHQRRNVEAQIVTAEAELVRLKDVASMVDRAIARKAELSERIDLIERLRATMRAPVKLLETVVHSVPHGLWLIEIKQAGMNVQMDGRAMSNNQVADFAQQMQDSGYFNKPVEISTTSELLEEVPVIRFVMKAEVAASGPIGVKPATPVVASTSPVPGAPNTPATTPAPNGPVVATVTPRGGGQ